MGNRTKEQRHDARGSPPDAAREDDVMLTGLMPVAASTNAATTDQIFIILVAIALFIILLVLALVLTFAIRFRRGSRAPRGELPSIMSRELELGWTAATLFVFVFLFWWAASAQFTALAVGKNVLEIHVVAKQWMWKTQHSNGAREINQLHVPLGVPVRLAMSSEDVIHSFFVPAFRLKKDVLPGRVTQASFQASKTGVFHLFCAELCGTDHARMIGRIVVMERLDYANWLSAQPEGDDLGHQGKVLFVSRGCAGCHADSSRVHAPRLAGLFGREVQLEGGRRVLADEAYIRDSILQSKRDIATGYEPIMPSYAGMLSEGELQALVAYIRSLSAPAAELGAAGEPTERSLVPGTPAQRSPAMVPGASESPSGSPGGAP
jgi:cytochrome c oxidase subunit 2